MHFISNSQNTNARVNSLYTKGLHTKNVLLNAISYHDNLQSLS